MASPGHLKCDSCDGIQFQTSADYDEHIKYNHACQLCMDTFPTLAFAKWGSEHYARKHQSKVCPQCKSASFTDYRDYLCHMRDGHEYCIMCDEVFSETLVLKTHTETLTHPTRCRLCSEIVELGDRSNHRFHCKIDGAPLTMYPSQIATNGQIPSLRDVGCFSRNVQGHKRTLPVSLWSTLPEANQSSDWGRQPHWNDGGPDE
ncbi:hypothetical protein BV22DRAFT_641007 [Leucogyrophana mollusca]|uniref:Uncharacterized protein n=1 Tax=Leucogyrophana mollusca TaxID=85980 RepID=A0ACB8BBT6_9AGAM|nr:hypothetical protein BV22DRAFT_641007 [Leucogyrophana mollusca]